MLTTLLKNWRTTAFGALSAGFGALGALTGAITWKQAVPAFLTAAIGFVARDGNPKVDH